MRAIFVLTFLALAGCTLEDRNELAVDLCGDISNCHVDDRSSHQGPPHEQAISEPGTFPQ